MPSSVNKTINPHSSSGCSFKELIVLAIFSGSGSLSKYFVFASSANKFPVEECFCDDFHIICF